MSNKVNLDKFLDRLLTFNFKCNLNIVTSKSLQKIEKKIKFLKDNNKLVKINLEPI